MKYIKRFESKDNQHNKNIPTAEEFLKNKPYMRSDLQCETNYQLMIEFAKLHVLEALKRSHSNMQLPQEDLEYTLSSYPLTNIK